MKTIWADFNAQEEGGRIRLTTKGSQDSIGRQCGLKVGEIVLLTDGEIEMVAEVGAWAHNNELYGDPICEPLPPRSRPLKDRLQDWTSFVEAEHQLAQAMGIIPGGSPYEGWMYHTISPASVFLERVLDEAVKAEILEQRGDDIELRWNPECERESAGDAWP